MLKDIMDTLVLLSRVEVKGQGSVKALAAAMIKLEGMQRTIEKSRKEKEVTGSEHCTENDV